MTQINRTISENYLDVHSVHIVKPLRILSFRFSLETSLSD